MEKPYLENLKIRHVILSRGRSNRVTTHKLLRRASLVVPADQADDYQPLLAAHPHLELVVIPPERIGVSAVRNWIVRRFEEEVIVMYDDDVTGLRTLCALRKTRPISLFRWSNNAAKDMLAEHMRGLTGEWTIPRRVEPLYLKQITAESRGEKVDARGRVSYFWKQTRRENHLGDCELMILVAAVITKTLQAKTKPN